MNAYDIKEANRLMWMVKGHLIPDEYSERDIESVLRSYAIRLWHNEEAYIHEDGFEEAWEKKYGSQQNQRIKHRGSKLSRDSIKRGTSQKSIREIITNSEAA